MSDFVFNVAKGRVTHLAGLPAANDAVIAVVLKNGAESDSTLQDYATLAAVLAASDEQTDMGRKTLTSVVVNIDNSNDRQTVDADDPVWSAATGDDFAKLLICYDPDTTASADANIIPLCGLDFAGEPIGTDVSALFGLFGFFQAS